MNYGTAYNGDNVTLKHHYNASYKGFSNKEDTYVVMANEKGPTCKFKVRSNLPGQEAEHP